MPSNSKERFGNRVESYVKYRPGYPDAIIKMLQKEYAFTNEKVVADIGAGTGISAELFLRFGYTVSAVEPNEPMRKKSEELLKKYPGFTAIDGSAEHTNLPGNSIDMIVAGQAFHWFDTTESKKEFYRILKPSGMLILIWNERKTSSEFEQLYDQLIVKHASDYVQVDHRNVDTVSINQFFHPAACRLHTFDNEQVFDFDGVRGRLLSSSYMPQEDDPGYPAMLEDLRSLFDRFQKNGQIRIEYDTKVYSGIFKN